MRTSEWLVVGYFLYLSLAALRPALGFARRLRVWGSAAGIGLVVVIIPRVPQTDLVSLARDWVPAAYIVAAYYVTGFFIDRPSPTQEAWLQRWDARLLPSHGGIRIPAFPRACLELAYGFCPVLIVWGFVALVWVGRGYLADRYWTMVTASELAAFASLPWFQTRPPWIVENREPTPELELQSANFVWLRNTSLCMNTFPSGHAAGSLAAALAVLPWAPLAGGILLALALSIALASVVGRYHYALDALTGLALACVICGVVWLAQI